MGGVWERANFPTNQVQRALIAASVRRTPFLGLLKELSYGYSVYRQEVLNKCYVHMHIYVTLRHARTVQMHIPEGAGLLPLLRTTERIYTEPVR